MKYRFTVISALTLLTFCKEPEQEETIPTAKREQCAVGDTCYVISEDGLNLRSSPKLTAKVIQVVPYGTELKILAVDSKLLTANKEPGHFVQVEWRKTKGWAFDGFLGNLKPTDVASRIAENKTREEIEKIRRLPAGEEKAEAVLKLRKRLSKGLNDVGQLFLDFEVCNIGLENKYCPSEEPNYFQGSQSEFFKAVVGAIQADDKGFLQKHSNCVINFSCYFCDSFATTHKTPAIEHLMGKRNKVNWKQHDVDESPGGKNGPRYVYVFDQFNGKDPSTAFFALGIVKHKKGWVIQKLGGQVMYNAKFESCQAGA